MATPIQRQDIHQPNSFYVTGGTLKQDAGCYVTRRADHQLYEHLCQGQFCYVLTSRQMGKSSLMIRTAARLREAGIGVAMLDLTAIGQNLTAEQWYDGLLSRIGRQLQLEEELEQFWFSNPRLGPMQRWMSAIEEVVLPSYPGRLVIFIDEIDTVRSLPFSTDEFFAGIREFYNRRTSESEFERLAFCLLGVASPSDLIRDTRMTPFNIGTRIELHDFTEDEAGQLAEGLGRPGQTGSELLNRVMHWTGGHPYLTQRLCRAIAEDDGVIDAKGVDRTCEELFFNRRAQEVDENLLFVRERMLRSEVELAGLLTLYDLVHRGKPVKDDESSALVTAVKLSGISRVQEGSLKVRNRIYNKVFDREWVKEHMPGAELRRQQAAFRKGLLRATAVAGAILVVITTLAFLAYQQRNIAKAEADRADQNFKRASLSDEGARKALANAEEQRRMALIQQGIAEEKSNLADQQRIRAENQEEANRYQLYSAQMNLAMQAWNEAGIPRMEELLNNHIPKPGQKDLRGFEWYYLWRLSHNGLRTIQQPGAITSIAVSPNGKTLAAVSDVFPIVKLWDTETGREILTLKSPTRLFPSVAFSADGKSLIAVILDGSRKIWDGATAKEISSLQLNVSNNSLSRMRLSPDGKILAMGSGDYKGDVNLLDVAKGEEIKRLKGNIGIVISLAFSPDSKTLAMSSGDKKVKLWDVTTGQELGTLNEQANVSMTLGSPMAFSPDGNTLAIGNNDGTIKLWRFTAGQKITTLNGHSGTVTSLAFSLDGETLASGSMDGTVRLWSVTAGQELATIKKHVDVVWTVKLLPDGKTLVTAGRDSTIKLWDLATIQKSTSLKAHSSRVNSMAFSPDGRTLVTAGDRAAKLWDMTTGRRIGDFVGHTGVVHTSGFSSDGKRLITGSGDRTAKLWDADTRQELMTFTMPEANVSTVALSPDGKTVATGSLNKIVKIWDAATGREITTLKSHTGYVWSVSFSPDGTRLATAGTDATIKLWDTSTWQEIIDLKGHLGGIQVVTFSSDGKKLASTSSDGVAKLWDVITGRELMAFKGHNSWLNCVAFSPDGSRLATGGNDDTVKLWDLTTGQEMITLKANTNKVWSVIFSPDGKTLISGGGDGTLKFWPAATEAEVRVGIRGKR